MVKNDLISRSAAMDIVKRTSGDYAAAWAEIKRLPAVDPEELRPRGRWIKSSEIFLFGYEPTPVFMCSKCRSEFCDVVNTIPTMYHYCPHCGAKMKEG